MRGLAGFSRCLVLVLGLAGAAQGQPVAETALAQLSQLPGSPWFWGSFLTCLNAMEGWAGPELPEWLAPSRVLSYTARKPRYDALGQALLDADGKLLNDRVHLSGRVFFPPAWRARALAPLPVLVFTHGTSMRKDAVASGFKGHEWVLGAAAAAYYGLVVVMPDLPGMGGDSSSYHPYCHRRSLAYAVVDALPAVRKLLQEDPYLLANGYRWDDRLFLMGYSEGGFASLAAARELETRPGRWPTEAGFHLTGTVCMAAPYDLSGTTLKAFLAGTAPAPHGFFVPFIVLGYQAVYGRIIDPLDILAPDLLESREDGNILQWADGSTEGLLVDAALARRCGVPADGLVLRRLFNPGWVAAVLDDPDFASTPVGRILRENDLADGWAPTRPILFVHSPDDGDVPIQNAFHAMAQLEDAVRREGRDPAGLLELSLLGKPGAGISHAAGVGLGIVRGLRWIDTRRAAPAPGLSQRGDGPVASAPGAP